MTAQQERSHRDATLGPSSQEEKPTKLGVWRDSLGLASLVSKPLKETSSTPSRRATRGASELQMERVSPRMVCEAPMTSQEGSEVAQLRLELDVSSLHPHRMPLELKSSEVTDWPLAKAPLRRGSPAKEVMDHKVQYFVTARGSSDVPQAFLLIYISIHI